MTRNCDVCHRPFEASRPNARFCGSTCRKRNSRGVSGSGTEPSTKDYDADPLVVATQAELEAAGRADSMLGQQALALARRMCGEVTGIAALSKELSRVMAAALADTPGSAASKTDDVDELRARRDAKRVG